MSLVGLFRVPAFSVSTLVLPVMFFSFFGLPHARDHFRDGTSVGAYLLASFGAYAVSSVMVFSFGIGAATARAQKTDLLQRATPLPPWVAIAASVLNAMVFALVSLVVLFGFGVVAGGVREPAGTWIDLTVRLVIGSIPLLALGMAIGYTFSANAAPAVTNLIYLPMAFASGLFVPIESMPDFIQKIAPYLPTYHYGQLGWQAVGHAQEPLAKAVLWLAVWTLVLLGVAVRAYRLEQMRKFG